MLNLKFIQENKETVIERLAVKNFDARESVEKIIALDNQRKSLQQEAEAKQAQMNIIAKEIGKLMQSGQKEAAEKARQETADLKSAIAGLNSRRTEVSNELTDILLRLPNMPHASVAKGKSEADNEIVKIVDTVISIHRLRAISAGHPPCEQQLAIPGTQQLAAVLVPGRDGLYRVGGRVQPKQAALVQAGGIIGDRTAFGI